MPSKETLNDVTWNVASEHLLAGSYQRVLYYTHLSSFQYIAYHSCPIIIAQV